MNLVIALLVTRTYVPKARLRQVVAGYGDSTDEAFERMFERDKEELRELGIPIETGGADPFGGDEPGYRIRRSDFELPSISLEPDEAAVLGMAARVWHQAGLARATSQALLKLRAAGVETDRSALAAVEPRVGAEEPAFEPMWQAVVERRRVRFDYRKAGAERPQRRRVEPWSVLSWRGRWYVAGHDLDRDAARLFRLSRVVGRVTPYGVHGAYEPPPATSVRAAAQTLAPPPPRGTARLAVRAGTGFGLRRRASAVRRGADGWDEVVVPYGDAGVLAEEIAPYGPDVVALAPEAVRVEVVRRLRAVADRPPTPTMPSASGAVR
jgi:predicted DNA-binding transcriptional regulator YafY